MMHHDNELKCSCDWASWKGAFKYKCNAVALFVHKGSQFSHWSEEQLVTLFHGKPVRTSAPVSTSTIG